MNYKGLIHDRDLLLRRGDQYWHTGDEAWYDCIFDSSVSSRLMSATVRYRRPIPGPKDTHPSPQESAECKLPDRKEALTVTGQGADTKQVGGDHYKNKGIQPWDYVAANNLGYFDGTAIKYLTRWKEKGGVEDLKKAIHFIEKLIEVEEDKKAT